MIITGPGARWVLLGGWLRWFPRGSRPQFPAANPSRPISFQLSSWLVERDMTRPGRRLRERERSWRRCRLLRGLAGRAPVTNTAARTRSSYADPRGARWPIQLPRALLAAEVLFRRWVAGGRGVADGAELAGESAAAAHGWRRVAACTRTISIRWDGRANRSAGRRSWMFDDGHDPCPVRRRDADRAWRGGSEVVIVPDITALTNTIPLARTCGVAGRRPDSPIGPAFFHTPGGGPGGAATVVGLTQFSFPTALRSYADEYFRSHRRGRQALAKRWGVRAAAVRSVLGV